MRMTKTMGRGITVAIAMALAMQVITPMVAGEGLGLVVFQAMTMADTGAGLVGGIGIVLVAVMLDRLTSAATARQRKAAGQLVDRKDDVLALLRDTLEQHRRFRPPLGQRPNGHAAARTARTGGAKCVEARRGRDAGPAGRGGGEAEDQHPGTAGPLG